MGRTLVFIAATAMLASPAHAQPQHVVTVLPIHPPNPPLHAPHDYRHVRISYPTPETRAKNLAELLDLSSEQKSRVLALFVEQDAKAKNLWSDASITGPARDQKIDALRDATVQQVRAVLTAEQRAKYDALAPPNPAPTKPHLEPDFSVQY
ncbi:MAG: hypothetical protein ACRD3E_00745 [Terriglobales bacterium]